MKRKKNVTKNFNFKNVSRLVLLVMVFLLGIGHLSAQLCNGSSDISVSAPTTVNGVTVTRTLAGNAVGTGPATNNYLNGGCQTTTAFNNAWLVPSTGASNTGSVTYTFSVPVNNVFVRILSATAAFLPAEAITFTTNSGVVTAQPTPRCNFNQSGNTFTAAGATAAEKADALVIVSSTTPYTSITVTNNGNRSNNGTIVVLCGDSVQPAAAVGGQCNGGDDLSFATPTSSAVVNGITITRTFTGSANGTAGPFNLAPPTFQNCVFVNSTNNAFLSTAGTGTVTYNFSKPVNNIVVRVTAMNDVAAPAEAVTFTTNNGVVTTTTAAMCRLIKSGNTYTASGANTAFIYAGAEVTVTSTLPYTSLTVSSVGNALNNGNVSTICMSSFASPVCYKPGAAGTALNSMMGITSLGRAGAQDADNWPMVRKGAWLVLESKTKGFVTNRVAFLAGNPVGIAPADFVEGMMVYDITNDCLKLYDGTAWKCYNTQACVDAP